MPTPTVEMTVFDGGELIAYQPAGQSLVVDVLAVRRPLTQSRQRNVERYITLEATDVVFHLDATPFGGATLAAGDTITDGPDVTYEVLFVERQVLNNTIVAVCRPPAV